MLFEAGRLRAGYGSINVLWDLSLAIEAGKLTCILGANGGGSIRYEGSDATNVATWIMAVAGNLLMGAFPPKCRANSGANLKLVYDMSPRLYERRDQLAGALSGGEALKIADHVYLVRGGQVVLSEKAAAVDLDLLHDLYFARGTLNAP